MSQPAQRPADDSGDAPLFSARSVMAAALAGVAFYYLLNPILAGLAGVPLPAAYLSFWSEWPLLGGWLLSALRSVLSYWPIAAALGLPLALYVRREFVFYGAVASGIFLLLDAQSDFDGWQSWWQVGPDYWFALKVDLAQSDPFGVIGRWLALPVCTGLWGSLWVARR